MLPGLFLHIYWAKPATKQASPASVLGGMKVRFPRNRKASFLRYGANLYKAIPILAIAPLWRGDSVEGIPTLINFCERLKDIIKKYDNVAMVEGWK